MKYFATLLKRILSNVTWLRTSTNIKAIHASDKSNMTLALLNESAFCIFCKIKISLDNLGGWTKQGNELKPFCDSVECLPSRLIEVTNGD